MLGEIESNMKKTFRIKCFKLVLGVSLCFLIYLLVSLIIPPLIGTHEKSDTQAEVSITTSERVCLIDNNEDALLWRLRLIRSAQEEIILSTFDFRADSSGTDVIAALWGAAERGVQVRLIIDGINAQLHLSGSDVFQALAAHDNVEVKFYNMEVELDHNLMTRHEGLYIIGDGSGITHSLSHASASGVYVARQIISKM